MSGLKLKENEKETNKMANMSFHLFTRGQWWKRGSIRVGRVEVTVCNLTAVGQDTKYWDFLQSLILLTPNQSSISALLSPKENLSQGWFRGPTEPGNMPAS